MSRIASHGSVSIHLGQPLTSTACIILYKKTADIHSTGVSFIQLLNTLILIFMIFSKLEKPI